MNSRVGNCTRFLHQGKELSGPENNEITQENRETHRALIFPITLIFKPTEILFICDGKFYFCQTIVLGRPLHYCDIYLKIKMFRANFFGLFQTKLCLEQTVGAPVEFIRQEQECLNFEINRLKLNCSLRTSLKIFITLKIKILVEIIKVILHKQRIKN